MGANGRVDLVIKQLDRIENKLDAHLKDTSDKFGVVHGRVSKVESRVARVEVIGGMLQTIWGALIGWLFQGR